YNLALTVTDVHGATSSTNTQLEIGNEPSQIEFSLNQNQSFYWADTGKLNYTFTVQDQENGAVTEVDNSNPLITFEYISPVSKKGQGHQVVDVIQQAKALVDANNCLGCHKVDEKLVGPAFRDVARKYQNDPNAIKYLV